MNHVVMIGNLASDPEVKTFSSGATNASFRIAVQRPYMNADGTRSADFFPVVCWRKTADFVGKYLHKGSKVAVTGSLQTRSYDAQDGTKRYVTEVIASAIESLGTLQANTSSKPAATYENVNAPANDVTLSDFFEFEDDQEDSLPF